jgi:hypothetical protein
LYIYFQEAEPMPLPFDRIESILNERFLGVVQERYQWIESLKILLLSQTDTQENSNGLILKIAINFNNENIHVYSSCKKYLKLLVIV